MCIEPVVGSLEKQISLSQGAKSTQLGGRLGFKECIFKWVASAGVARLIAALRVSAAVNKVIIGAKNAVNDNPALGPSLPNGARSPTLLLHKAQIGLSELPLRSSGRVTERGGEGTGRLSGSAPR